MSRDLLTLTGVGKDFSKIESSGGRLALARDHGIERACEILERGAAGVFVPRVEIDGVDCAHVHRQAGCVEAHGHQDVAVGGFARLATHPAGADRSCRPDHDHRCGRQQFGFDLVVEFLARRDFRIPPDRPPLRFDRGDQRRDRIIAHRDQLPRG